MSGGGHWAEQLLYRHPVSGERYMWVPLLQRVEVYAKGARTAYAWVFVNYAGTQMHPGELHPRVWRAAMDLLAGRYDERRGGPKIQA